MKDSARIPRQAKIILSLVLVATAGAAIAQPNTVPCAIDIPVNVVVPDGRLIRGLKTDQFVAQTNHGPLRVVAATDDSGPRRILLVLETGGKVVQTGRDVPQSVRSAESSIVADMLSEARPEDSFALLTARGPREEVPFGQSRDAIMAAVKEIETQTGGNDYGDGVLDVLSTAAKWFHEPKPGDAIFLMTMGFESEHKTGYSKVQKEMATRQVRVFGLFFAPIIVASPEGGIGLARSGAAGSEYVVTYAFIQNQDAASLSRSSGGYMIQEDIVGDPQHEYKLTAQKLEELKTAASRMHSAMTGYYRLTLDSSPSQFTLGVAADLRKKVPNAEVIYPAQLPACPAAKSP